MQKSFGKQFYPGFVQPRLTNGPGGLPGLQTLHTV